MKSHSTKEKLLQTASELFARKGPAATSVDEVVSRAGCNKRMVYHYFGSKEALSRAVLMAAYEKIASFEEESLRTSSPGSPRKVVEKLITDQLNFLAQNPRIVALLMWENLNSGKTIRSLPVKRTKNLVLTTLKKVLGEGRARRSKAEIEQVFVSIIATAFFTFSNRHTLNRILGFDPSRRQYLDRRRKHLIELFIRGLGLT